MKRRKIHYVKQPMHVHTICGRSTYDANRYYGVHYWTCVKSGVTCKNCLAKIEAMNTQTSHDDYDSGPGEDAIRTWDGSWGVY